jgi:hypothetical protein
MSVITDLAALYHEYHSVNKAEKEVFLKNRWICSDLTLQPRTGYLNFLFALPCCFKQFFTSVWKIDLLASIDSLEKAVTQDNLPDVIKSAKMLRIYATKLPHDKQKQARKQIDRLLEQNEPKTQVIKHQPNQIEKAKEKAFWKLAHRTNLDHLVNIVRSGELLPYRITKTSGEGAFEKHDQSQIFFTIFPKTNSPAAINPDLIFSKTKAILVFSKKLFGRSDYHISEGWYYGKFREPNQRGGSYCPQNIDQVDLLKASGENEVVFQNPVSLKHLKAIWIPSDKKKEVVNLLNNSRILPPNLEKTWEELIEARDDFPTEITSTY